MAIEWRINVSDETSEKLVSESGYMVRLWLGLKGLILRIWSFIDKAWKLAVAEPRKVIHGLKVGLCISVVSLFYYMRPLYDGVGGNAMWAIMTVVVVFEPTIGATFCKCINRVIGTFLAGSLGVGVHLIASHSSKNVEPVILGASVFVLASAATFSRFMPTVKAKFDYGVLIFILTFSLVSVSGYRVDKLFELARNRVSTIAIGTSLCIIVSTMFCPIWAGSELHQLVCQNLEKLAYSLNESVAEYFKDDRAALAETAEDRCKKMIEYKCVLNSKATEESMVRFARWEPPHGRVSFRHPWKQYLKIGAAMRSCAYCIEAINGCLNSKIQAPRHLKRQLKRKCLRLSTTSANVLEEVTIIMKTMRKSSIIEVLVGEMTYAVEELQNAMKSIPDHLIENPTSLNLSETSEKDHTAEITILPLQILSLATTVSMLIQGAAKIEEIVDAVDQFADLANFKPVTDKKPNHTYPQSNKTHISNNQDHQTMKASAEV